MLYVIYIRVKNVTLNVTCNIKCYTFTRIYVACIKKCYILWLNLKKLPKVWLNA